MSQYVSELCQLLVYEIYGELTSRVYEALSCFGRLTLAAIVHHTGLTPRQIKHGLAVLVQQHLILWHTSPDSDATFYEADWTSSYALVRLGKFVKIVENRHGQVAGDIINNLLISGHAEVGDLSQAYEISHPSRDHKLLPSKGRPINWKVTNVDRGLKRSLKVFHSELNTLICDGFLFEVRESHFHSDEDNGNAIKLHLLSLPQYSGVMKGEQRLAFDEAVKKRMIECKSNSDKVARYIERQAPYFPVDRKKRKRGDTGNDIERPDKRRQIESVNTNTEEHFPESETELEDYLDSHLPLQVNFDKFATIVRNERLVQLATQVIGISTAQVYAELLRLLELQVAFCGPEPYSEPTIYVDSDDDPDPEDGPRASTIDLTSRMVDYGNLSEGIAESDPANINISQIIHPKKPRRKIILNGMGEVESQSSSNDTDDDNSFDNAKQSKSAEVNGTKDTNVHHQLKSHCEEKYHKSRASDGNTTSIHFPNEDHVRQHLLLLAEHPYKFVTYIRRRSHYPESWTVNFPSLAHRLRVVELEKIIMACHGLEGLRVIRILQVKGKLAEKELGASALMNQKVMRCILTAMHQSGHIELQEIPRDAQRQPSRCIFLWYFDTERCRQTVLEQTYKTMVRCIQRIKVEREAIRSIISKAARTDVIGNEEKFLSLEERTVLEVWREKEEKLLGEMQRLDDVVSVLRGY